MAKTTSWRMKLKAQQDLKKKGAGLLHERVTLCIQIYEDADFRNWCESEGINEVDYLDTELADSAMDFLSLRTVMDNFPKIEDWERLSIRELVAEVIVSQRGDRVTDVRTSWKQKYEEAVAECERLRGELAALQKQLTQTMDIVGVMASRCAVAVAATGRLRK